jgi:putative N6-adenine-specific DNA methylase
MQNQKDRAMKFFATAAWGTEPALRDELRELRIPKVRCDRGGVNFEGDWKHAWLVCLQSRIALRVMLPLLEFEARSGEELYEGVRQVDWSGHLSPKHTLAITAFCRDSALTHTNYIAQKTKDAVVDQQREKIGSRSSVDRQDPDVSVFVHIKKNQTTLYLDLSGEALHRRGYRKQTVKAPLKENLAAALVRLSGWDRKRPFCDPLCGSGTIAIEAALMSRRISPGLDRHHFGFERWPGHDESARKGMSELREQALDDERLEGPDVFASDIDEQAIQAIRRNARAAGAEMIIEQRAVADLAPLGPSGMIVTNPPYGMRLETDRPFYQGLGQTFKTLKGHRIGVILANRNYERALQILPEKFQLLYNGDIQCRLVVYEIR